MSDDEDKRNKSMTIIDGGDSYGSAQNSCGDT